MTSRVLAVFAIAAAGVALATTLVISGFSVPKGASWWSGVGKDRRLVVGWVRIIPGTVIGAASVWFVYHARARRE